MIPMPALAVLLAASSSAAPAPAPGTAVYGGVPSGTASADPLPLGLRDAVERGLQHNLALILAEQGIRHARGARWEALSELLPHLSGHAGATRQKISLEAFGFSGFPGFPTLIGPFNV